MNYALAYLVDEEFVLVEAVCEPGEEVADVIQPEEHEEHHAGEEDGDLPQRDEQVGEVAGRLHPLFDRSQVLDHLCQNGNICLSFS